MFYISKTTEHTRYLTVWVDDLGTYKYTSPPFGWLGGTEIVQSGLLTNLKNSRTLSVVNTRLCFVTWNKWERQKRVRNTGLWITVTRLTAQNLSSTRNSTRVSSSTFAGDNACSPPKLNNFTCEVDGCTWCISISISSTGKRRLVSLWSLISTKINSKQYTEWKLVNNKSIIIH